VADWIKAVFPSCVRDKVYQAYITTILLCGGPYLVHGLNVGPAAKKQPHHVEAAARRGQDQGSITVLRACGQGLITQNLFNNRVG
jgi:hypothetical protein